MLVHMLLFNINRKAYVGSYIGVITFDLSDLDRSEWRSFRFRSIISRKGAELGYMLLLNINRKVLWGSIGAIAFDFRALERSRHCQGHFDFKRLYLVKEPS